MHGIILTHFEIPQFCICHVVDVTTHYLPTTSLIYCIYHVVCFENTVFVNALPCSQFGAQKSWSMFKTLLHLHVGALRRDKLQLLKIILQLYDE